MIKYEDYMSIHFMLSSGEVATNFVRSSFDYGVRQRRAVSGYDGYNVKLVLPKAALEVFQTFWADLNDGNDKFYTDEVVAGDFTLNKTVRFTNGYSISDLGCNIFSIAVPLELIQTGTPA